MNLTPDAKGVFAIAPTPFFDDGRIDEASIDRLAERARAEGWTHEEFLAACLEREVASRQDHGGENRVKGARFPARKTIEDFEELTESLRALAQLELRIGQVTQALSLIEDALSIAEHNDYTYLLPSLRRTEGEILLANGSTDVARERLLLAKQEAQNFSAGEVAKIEALIESLG